MAVYRLTAYVFVCLPVVPHTDTDTPVHFTCMLPLIQVRHKSITTVLIYADK